MLVKALAAAAETPDAVDELELLLTPDVDIFKSPCNESNDHV
jgi:hypothetical protein